MICRKIKNLFLFNNNNRNIKKLFILLFIIAFTFVLILSDKLLFPSIDLSINSFQRHQTFDNKVTNNAKNYNNIDIKTIDNNSNDLDLIKDESKTTFNNNSIIRFGGFDYNTIKISITVCGDQSLEQSLITLKSAVILTKTRLHFIIMSDEKNMRKISHYILSEWPKDILKRISFEIHLVSFPNAVDVEEWRQLFKLCAAQRLFLPTILNKIDSVLYVDTDVLFLSPVDRIWSFFDQMNSSQIAAMAPESEDFASSWYHRFAKHPYVGRLGVNSGVMLMNLTRMRAFEWHNYLEPYLSQYRLNIVWGDQDIINIIFHFHSDKLFLFGCKWNYRPDHCIYTRVCKEAEKSGVSVLHGNRGVFLSAKQPAFRAIYQAFHDFDFKSELSALVQSMKDLLDQTMDTNCGKARNSFLMTISQLVNS